MVTELPVNILGLIPHRPPMLLVDRLVSLTGQEAVSESVFSAESIFLKGDGSVEEAVLFEMMAQTFAAATAVESGGEGPKTGYLVGLKRVIIYGSAQAGVPVAVRVKTISQVDDFSVVEGEVHQGGRLLAVGQVTIFVPREAAV
ncbi:MAG: hypothetical protein LBT47_05520 [Deltaproteobacteria bacterium]|jgi:predicted hotdog family 3-hydroxylacyl-ACP dehydratase|nr:hypothetical protein [Deltaproteobacteria bacterium]